MHGLANTFAVDCPFCGHKNKVSTSRKHRHGSRGPSAFDVNSRAALGALNAGIGHTHLSALTDVPNIPQMNRVLRLKKLQGRAVKRPYKLKRKMLSKVIKEP